MEPWQTSADLISQVKPLEKPVLVVLFDSIVMAIATPILTRTLILTKTIATMILMTMTTMSGALKEYVFFQ